MTNKIFSFGNNLSMSKYYEEKPGKNQSDPNAIDSSYMWEINNWIKMNFRFHDESKQGGL
jgi:hypothetical protein